ncbi:MAG: alpha-L-fucosidase [bacterium]|nr:alpha-L-fucosidase [bacterium]
MRRKKPDTKQQWFKDAKFGLFVHWGLYALLGGEYQGQRVKGVAEWIMDTLQIPPKEYETLAAQFRPIHFDAEALVKQAKEWGMKYLVFTAKHHEGFAMYNSACSPYNVVKATPDGRDILKELQLACEKYEMPLGLYYSQAQDWHDPNGLAAGRDNSGKEYQFYLDHKVKPQLRELLQNYGKIALIWFDTPLETSREQSQELYDLVKSIQPNCIVSGRIGNELGEYMTTGDNFLPRLPYEGDWELPATLNDTWGYKRTDENWKQPDEVIRLLLKVVNRGGNYLLNIGPDATGAIPEGSLRVLNEVGRYVRENAEGIFGTRRMGYYPYELDWAELTWKPHKLYVHLMKTRERIELPNVKNQALQAKVLGSGELLEVQNTKNCEGIPTIVIFLPERLWQEKNYCVEISLKEEEPSFEEEIGG